MKGDLDATRIIYLRNGLDKRLVPLNHRSLRKNLQNPLSFLNENAADWCVTAVFHRPFKGAGVNETNGEIDGLGDQEKRV
ncbi:hypothetical protein [Geobacillus sp. YF-1]|uniref:hypothetical protein n=1 Tax=Geobacillus sp. YF-1 TaxID=3457480 RepID=UPI0040452517